MALCRPASAEAQQRTLWQTSWLQSLSPGIQPVTPTAQEQDRPLEPGGRDETRQVSCRWCLCNVIYSVYWLFVFWDQVVSEESNKINKNEGNQYHEPFLQKKMKMFWRSITSTCVSVNWWDKRITTNISDTNTDLSYMHSSHFNRGKC